MADTAQVKIELVAELAKLSQGLNTASSKLGSWANGVSGILTTAAKGFAALTATATAVGAGMVALTMKTAAAGDELAKMSTRTGLSVGLLSKLKYMLDLNDASLGDVAVAMRSLSRNLLSADEEGKEAQETFKALNVPLAALQKMKPDEMLLATVKALAKIENQTMRAAYAQRIFGRGAEMLMPTILDMTKGFDKASREAAKFGLVWTAQQAKQAEAAADAWTRFKSVIRGLGETFGKRLLPVVTDVRTRMANWLAQFVPYADKAGQMIARNAIRAMRWIQAEMVPVAQTARKVIQAIWADVTKLADGIRQQIANLRVHIAALDMRIRAMLLVFRMQHPQLMAALDKTKAALKEVGDFIKEHKEYFLAAAAAVLAFRGALMAAAVAVWGLRIALLGLAATLNPWILIPAAIGAALFGLYKHFPAVKQFLDDVWGKMQGLGRFLRDEVMPILEALGSLIMPAVWWTLGLIAEQMAKVWSAVQSGWAFVVQIWGEVLGKLTELWTWIQKIAVEWGLWSVIQSVLADLGKGVDWIWGKLKAAAAVISTDVKAAVDVVWPFVKERLDQFKTWWDENLPLIKQYIEVVARTAIDFAKQVWEILKPIAAFLIDTLMANIETLYDGVTLMLTGLWFLLDPIIEFLESTLLNLVKAAMQLITGDWKGAWDTMATWYEGWRNRIRDAITETMKGIGIIIRDKVAAIWNEFTAWFWAKWDAFIGNLTARWEQFKQMFSFWKKSSPSIVELVAGGLDEVQAMFGAAAVNIADVLHSGVNLDGFGQVAAGMTRTPPAAMAALAGVTLNVNIHGGLVDRRFVEKELGPVMERVFADGLLKWRTWR